jgi:hypothetical protein
VLPGPAPGPPACVLPGAVASVLANWPARVLARVARIEPVRMSTNEPAIDAVSGSFSTITPSATATAGFT